jgi:NDP-sugar pyrophosphorylase family protein
MTIGYRKYEHKLPFGVLELKGENLCGIIEKPGTKYNVSAGVYILNESVIDLVPDNSFFTIPELVNKLSEAKLNIGAYLIKEYWLGIENIDHFEEAIKELNRLEAVIEK